VYSFVYVIPFRSCAVHAIPESNFGGFVGRQQSLVKLIRKGFKYSSLTKTTLTNNNECGDDSGAKEMVWMENLSATLLNLYCSMLCIVVLLVENQEHLWLMFMKC